MQPIPLSAPAKTSRIVMTRNIGPPVPASGLFAKCCSRYSRFPRRSTTLSIPDWRNKIARNPETSICRSHEASSGDRRLTMAYSSTAKVLLSNCVVPVLLALGCRPQMSVNIDALVDGSEQLVVVTTSGWTTTTGALRRFERSAASSEWRLVDSSVPVVVGRTGLAWGVGFDYGIPEDPKKHEGDGKAPAGVFPLDTVFGFAPRGALVKLPYQRLLPTTDCVDDTSSTHYNTVVDRNEVERVD